MTIATAGATPPFDWLASCYWCLALLPLPEASLVLAISVPLPLFVIFWVWVLCSFPFRKKHPANWHLDVWLKVDMMSAKTKSRRASRVIVVCYLQHSYRSYPVLIYSRQRQDISCWMWRGIFDTWRLEMTSTRVCSTSLCQTVCNMVMVNVCFSLDCLQFHYHVAHTHTYIYTYVYIFSIETCSLDVLFSRSDPIETQLIHIYIHIHVSTFMWFGL